MEAEYLTEPSPSTSSSEAEPGPQVSQYVRAVQPTYTARSIRDSGTLRPGAEWYPEWMKYRRREDNYVFWQDKFLRCSLEIPDIEKRWTVFSSLWWLVMEFKFFGVPPALRFLWFLAWRGIMQKVYEGHKALVLWQCKLDAYLACKGSAGAQQGFSRAMALRRLHWKNTLLAELLYTVNICKTGRIHLLPPVKAPFQRPTFFFLF